MAEQPKDLRKLCILNVKDSETDDEIRNLCEEFGQVISFNRPPNNKRLAFPLFSSFDGAAAAKEGLSAKGYNVDYANARPGNAGSSGGSNGRPKRDEFRSTQNVNGNGGGSENGSDANHSIESDNRPFGKCLKCGDKAFWTCERCCDFYCSHECQASDWLIHKQNCFPMPKLMPSKSQQNLAFYKSTEKLKLNASPVADPIDAADGPARGHSSKEVEPTQASPAQASPARNPTPKQIEFDDQKPSKPMKPEPVAKDAQESSDSNSVNDNSAASLRQKLILLSNYGDSADSSTTAINRTTSDAITNGSEVLITHVRNYETVYVRAVDAEAAYSKLINEVMAAAETAPSLKTYPYPREDTVLAPFDGAYYRGFVLSCNESAASVRVGYIDFGNSKDVPFSTLKVLPKELKERPRLTFSVKLKGLKQEPETKEAATMQAHLESISESGSGQKLKLIGKNVHVATNDVVELFDVISNRSINDDLNAMVQQRYYLADLQQKIVDPNELPLLMALDTLRIGENIITCLVKEDVPEFLRLDQSTQEYGEKVKNAPAYKPKQRELCVVHAKDDGEYVWYRCKYQTELVNDRAQVYCIDYGKIDTVRENNIRAMPTELLHQIKSIVCYIKNGHTVSHEKLTQYFNDHPEFTPTSIEYDEKEHKHVITVDFSVVA